MQDRLSQKIGFSRENPVLFLSPLAFHRGSGILYGKTTGCILFFHHH